MSNRPSCSLSLNLYLQRIYR